MLCCIHFTLNCNQGQRLLQNYQVVWVLTSDYSKCTFGLANTGIAPQSQHLQHKYFGVKVTWQYTTSLLLETESRLEDAVNRYWLIMLLLECFDTVCLIPAETRGQSGSMDSSGVSKGTGLDTQLQQCCRMKGGKKQIKHRNSEGISDITSQLCVASINTWKVGVRVCMNMWQQAYSTIKNNMLKNRNKGNNRAKKNIRRNKAKRNLVKAG